LSLSHYYNLFVYHLRKYRNNQEMRFFRNMEW